MSVDTYAKVILKSTHFYGSSCIYH